MRIGAVNKGRYKGGSVRLPAQMVEKNIQNPILRRFMTASVGYRDGQQNRDHAVQRGPNRESLVMYCTAGEGWFETGGRKWRIGPGDIFLCAEGHVHAYGAAAENPWSIYWSYFTGEDAPALFETMEVSMEDPVLHIGEKPRIVSLFMEAIGILERGYTVHHLVHASNCLREILSYLSLLCMNSISSRGTPYSMQTIISFIMENLEGSLELKQLSDMANMSKDHFSKVFKEKTGFTPIDYFIRLKMQKACALLDTTGLKIGEVSSMLGYQDVYYFSRIFKSKVGCSPRQYRSSFKG